jgi:hypothetical protein
MPRSRFGTERLGLPSPPLRWLYGSWQALWANCAGGLVRAGSFGPDDRLARARAGSKDRCG